jgi:hypothetical protein
MRNLRASLKRSIAQTLTRPRRKTLFSIAKTASPHRKLETKWIDAQSRESLSFLLLPSVSPAPLASFDAPALCRIKRRGEKIGGQRQRSHLGVLWVSTRLSRLRVALLFQEMRR